MAIEGYIACVVDPRACGIVKAAATWRGISWNGHFADRAALTGAEDTHAQSKIFLARNVGALLGQHDPAEDNIAALVLDGLDVDSLKRPTSRRLGDIRHDHGAQGSS